MNETEIKVSDLIDYDLSESSAEYSYLARSAAWEDAPFITVYLQIGDVIENQSVRLGITITAKRQGSGTYQWERPEVTVPSTILNHSGCGRLTELIEIAADVTEKLEDRFNGAMPREDYNLIQQIRV